jgi:hypothetical protein
MDLETVVGRSFESEQAACPDTLPFLLSTSTLFSFLLLFQ